MNVQIQCQVFVVLGAADVLSWKDTFPTSTGLTPHGGTAGKWEDGDRAIPGPWWPESSQKAWILLLQNSPHRRMQKDPPQVFKWDPFKSSREVLTDLSCACHFSPMAEQPSPALEENLIWLKITAASSSYLGLRKCTLELQALLWSVSSQHSIWALTSSRAPSCPPSGWFSPTRLRGGWKINHLGYN